MNPIDYGGGLTFPQNWAGEQFTEQQEREAEFADARAEERCRCVAGDEERTARACPVHRREALDA